jgi:eukaryotic-like serine/threonine-protein kinase
MDKELKSGSTLGRYELLIRLGRGGMASVWVARERSPSGKQQRLVAVKAMLPELARHSDFRAMFLEEGQIVRSIDHPNVVTVHEVAEDHGILYMAMEWVEGDSLRAVIKEAQRRRPIPPEMAVKIIADAAAGLHAAHELRGWDGELRNIVHCDVSPHNILVGIDGHAKLVDFGVANAAAHSDLGSEDKIKGKFGYMSPEQAGAQKLDRRSDVFALGIVLFELTTGERLFKGENAAHTLELVKRGKIPEPRELHPKYPERLSQIVTMALQRDPRRRFQTAQQLRDALERYLVEERIMVSHASVGQLVRRVLGQRIEQQRDSLRKALTASDGMLYAGLIPTQPALEHSSPNLRQPSPFPVMPSEPPTSTHSHSKTGTPHPQTLEPPSRRRSSLAPLFSALGGIGAAAAAIFWAMQHRPTQLATGNASESAQQADNKPATAAKTEEGMSIDNLPLAASAAAQPAQPGRPGPSRPRATKMRLEEEDEAAAEKAAPKPDKAEDKPEEPAAEQPAEPEPEVKNPYEGAAQLPPNGQRPPLNRGAALAALGAAASAAIKCKRPDGPSGAGRASVTFSPDGPVSSVNISPPFAGTSVGNCIASAFRNAHVPPFSGGAITLPKGFAIPE